MANVREIQNRIKSIEDTKKITNAMYMISTTKLRRAKKQLEETEPYFYTLQSVIARILRHLPDIENQFFSKHEKKTSNRIKGYIVVTGDKGMAGAYNHNVLKLAQQEIKKKEQEQWKLFVVGEVGRQYFASKGIPVAEQFLCTAQNPTLHRSRIISEIILEQFENEELDEVYIIFNRMKNSITTEPEMLRLLPLIREDYVFQEMKKIKIFEEEITMLPSPNAVLDNIVPDCVRGYIYGALVEAFCSEQSARMVAMQGANKSASAMIQELSISYNRLRQAMITQEITEVVSGAKAQKNKKKKLAQLKE